MNRACSVGANVKEFSAFATFNYDGWGCAFALLLRGAVQMANHSLLAKVVVNAAEEIGG